MKFRIFDNDLVQIEETPELNDDSIDVPDLGFYDDAEVKDAITLVWKQLFNELVDEAENRIDKQIGDQRGKQDVSVLLDKVSPMISSLIRNLRTSFEQNVDKVHNHLVKFVKQNYSTR